GAGRGQPGRRRSAVARAGAAQARTPRTPYRCRVTPAWWRCAVASRDRSRQGRWAHTHGGGYGGGGALPEGPSAPGRVPRALRCDPSGRGSVEKYDIKVAHRELYAPKGRDFHIVEVPPLTYLAVDGSGDPNTSPQYAAAVEALYTLAYTTKARSRTRHGRDFVVAPLEGLWRAEDMSAFVRRDKAAWRWTLPLALPDWVTGDDVEAARADARRKKDLPALDRVTVRTLTEGTSVQILHIGPYDDEGPTIERLHRTYLPEHGLVPDGDHHEIYLSDPRRTAPARLRTILRQPVRPA